MSARATAPLRLWLILVLMTIAIVPTLTTWGLTQGDAWWQRRADQTQWAAVRATLGNDVMRWHDPTWQRHAALVFAARHVDVGLVDKHYGPLGLVFVTPGARPLMSAYVPMPALAGQNGKACAETGAGKRALIGLASCGKPR